MYVESDLLIQSLIVSINEPFNLETTKKPNGTFPHAHCR